MSTSTADALFSTVPAAGTAPQQGSAVTHVAGAPAYTGGAQEARLLRECYVEFTLDNETPAEIYNFHNHHDVRQLRQYFRSVELVWLKVVIQQVKLASMGELADYTPRRVRYGPAPVDLASGARGHSYTDQGLSRTARLEVAWTTAPVPLTLAETWGRGGQPWPPGVQLELNAAEIWASYVGFLVGSPDYDSHEIAVAYRAASAQVGEPGEKGYKAAVPEREGRDESEPWDLLEVSIRFEVQCTGTRF